ncbi:hypothetical protein CY34DRAFT_802366 [Suillus luteus UH-Slu-Lm8-n1]|uniref:Uncharacterized protein n=1 Tax=Suillus luteus UH-Slu-Lm8-n1 TaxID=930992 RepID=A0A0D0BF87_9AGAM|nr:hypothetical protein CY34DRAFT_802366 [Suillus luteus UH-Slu-Lm8-n1]
MAAVLRSPTHSPVLAAQLPPSSTRASDSSCSHTHSASVPMRRIRFAPLPEPTAQDDSSNTIMDTHLRALSPLSSNIVNVQHSTPSKQKSKSSLSRQFNLFKRSSTDPTVHRPQPYGFGAPLSRSASIAIPSNGSQPRYLSTVPSPSGGNHHVMPKNHFLSSSPPMRPKVPINGMHMLNGRAYGSKRRPLTNLFANVHEEPEFVEWGYGGMGSISCSSDSKYSVLAKGAPALLSHGHAQKVVVGGAARERKDGVGVSELAGCNGDDGSGMEWVRKRRQERERRARSNTC